MSLAKPVFVVAALVLASACGGAPTAKAGPYGNNYVKGFPLESNGRPADSAPRDGTANRDYDQQRMMEEAERERREEEQERQEQQQQREQDRVGAGGGDRCLSCP